MRDMEVKIQELHKPQLITTAPRYNRTLDDMYTIPYPKPHQPN